MLGFLYAHLDSVLALAILVARLGDIGTTYLVTPTLRLEANPIVRRLGWPFAIATLAVCAVPYFSPELGLMVLIPSLMVSASNAGRIWMARALGEAETKALMLHVARRSRLRHALAGLFLSTGFGVLVGLTVLLFYPDPSEDWGFWIGAGFVTYAVAIAVWGTTSMRRLFAEAAAQPEPGAASASTPGGTISS